MSILTLLDSETKTKEIELLPFQEITLEKSRQLRYTYRDGALRRNSELLGAKDSTSVLLSRETLLRLADACEGRQNCVDGTDIVLAHFATYPLDYPDAELAGRQTLVFEISGANMWFGEMPICPPFCGPDGASCKKD